MAKKTLKNIDKEARIEVAEKLLPLYEGMNIENRNKVFGIMLKRKVSKGKSLLELFEEDCALHIVNIMLNKLQFGVYTEEADISL